MSDTGTLITTTLRYGDLVELHDGEIVKVVKPADRRGGMLVATPRGEIIKSHERDIKSIVLLQR